ncbi:hypothetical protein [Lacipirellula sp.]|uniref:hypothetical protein n=1 Tax=Lacipirellula sp. TaxID=2691419 RepID=UPI003D0ADE42
MPRPDNRTQVKKVQDANWTPRIFVPPVHPTDQRIAEVKAQLEMEQNARLPAAQLAIKIMEQQRRKELEAEDAAAEFQERQAKHLAHPAIAGPLGKLRKLYAAYKDDESIDAEILEATRQAIEQVSHPDGLKEEGQRMVAAITGYEEDRQSKIRLEINNETELLKARLQALEKWKTDLSPPASQRVPLDTSKPLDQQAADLLAGVSTTAFSYSDLEAVFEAGRELRKGNDRPIRDAIALFGEPLPPAESASEGEAGE